MLKKDCLWVKILITGFVHISTNRQHRITGHKWLCGAVVEDEMCEEEVVGLNLGVCTYSKQVKNKSCELWPVLSTLGYFKKNFLFLLDSKLFLKNFENYF